LSLKLLAVLALVAFAGSFAAGQSPELQQRIAEAKEAAARNKQALAQYTWTEQVSISLKGELKKQEHFQVRLGPDGKPLKTSLDAPPAEESEHREGRLKKHIVEKKTEEYKEYADRIKELIQQYLPPERDALARAYEQGNVMVGPQPNTPGQYRLVISNYIKQGDNMTLVIDKTQREISSVSISTYLDDPKDAVNVSAVFERIAGGPNHVASQVINGVSKQLTVAITNGNYQRL
jgi:hypothetical protein